MANWFMSCISNRGGVKMYKLKYYDYDCREIKIPQERDKIYKSSKQAWWTHYNNPPISVYNEVVVVKI